MARARPENRPAIVVDDCYLAAGSQCGRFTIPRVRVPRRLRFAIKQFGLDRQRVLDLGCGPGLYLRGFGPGSVGLDLSPEAAQQAGHDARKWNFTDGIPNDLGGFDAIWCSNLLEHVLAPHSFLIDLRSVLHADGRLFIVVPQTTHFRRGPWRGWAAADHVNFFTPHTLAQTIARAGYRVEFLGSPSAPFLNQLFRVGPTLLAACRPIPDFQYALKAHKRLVGGRIEFR
jgi:SAM-dependent methyltransferase